MASQSSLQVCAGSLCWLPQQLQKHLRALDQERKRSGDARSSASTNALCLLRALWALAWAAVHQLRHKAGIQHGQAQVNQQRRLQCRVYGCQQVKQSCRS